MGWEGLSSPNDAALKMEDEPGNEARRAIYIESPYIETLYIELFVVWKCGA